MEIMGQAVDSDCFHHAMRILSLKARFEDAEYEDDETGSKMRLETIEGYMMTWAQWDNALYAIEMFL